ncbi:MAG: O-succinylhomoserine sulfhydrylase [Alphaproteobacteria bacterium]|nr:O-succinylhomoserine sulfhydrylase [Alphaproteobacteria bacterium]
MADNCLKGGKKTKLATTLVRGGLTRTPFAETSEALFMTSGYIYGSAAEAERAFEGKSKRYIYSRYANPTVTMFETRLAQIEGADICVGTASGMAAVFTSLACFLRAGDRVVASRALFGSCHYIVNDVLPQYGIKAEFVDGTDLKAWARALSKPARAVFLESPSNPTLEIIDIPAVAKLARRAGAKVVVDNVFATPLLQKSLKLGADIVVYSATKHIDGQGRTLGGAILTNDRKYFENHLTPFFRHTGPALSPFNAWVLLKGLETLDLRVRRQCETALALARFLEKRREVSRVLYPGLPSHPQYKLARKQMGAGGTLVSFELKGGKKAAFRFLDALRVVDISNNLGDAKSLITHPATTTHQRLGAAERAKMGIGDGLVRLSVGLEDADDLQADLVRALAATKY